MYSGDVVKRKEVSEAREDLALLRRIMKKLVLNLLIVKRKRKRKNSVNERFYATLVDLPCPSREKIGFSLS
jgi:hypothetical protein